MEAYPQPLAIACSRQLGPATGRLAGPLVAPLVGRRGGPKPKPLISIITGTRAESPGTVTLAWMLTESCGEAELSTWPTTVRVMVGPPPLAPRVVAVTSHVTGGTFGGMRPYTSRSKSSRISARRAGHCAAVVTFVPSFIFSTSGIVSAYRLALASSNVDWSRGLGPGRSALTPNW